MQALQTTAQEQFINDYLLVAMNESGAYNEMCELAQGNLLKAADKIQEDFEDWVQGVAEAEKAKGNQFQALLLSQLLFGWGSDTFYKIALAFRDEN
jgi:hypothetical protein